MKHSFSIAICEAVILSNGNQSKKFDSLSFVPDRFAYSSVLILTGLLCTILTCSPKKRTTNFFCFLFAVASLVLASFGSSRLAWPKFWNWKELCTYLINPMYIFTHNFMWLLCFVQMPLICFRKSLLKWHKFDLWN